MTDKPAPKTLTIDISGSHPGVGKQRPQWSSPVHFSKPAF